MQQLEFAVAQNFALCKTCNVDINVSHGGIRKHLATTKRQQLVKAAGNSVDLRKFMPQSPIEDAVTRSEVLFANFIAEHNLSFSTTNHLSHLTHVMFPDSKIARAFKSARTKTTCIIKHAHFIDPVIQHCQNGPFSILCNEDSNTEDKHLAILVRLWDDELGKPFLDMPVCNIGTAATLLNVLMHHLKKGLSLGQML